MLLTALAQPALAAALGVAPLRLDIAGQQRSTALTLTNRSSTPLPVQLELVAWAQDASGRDVYTPTRDLFFAPPIVTVPARGESVVRFRLRKPVAAGVERSYRVYVTELTGSRPTGGAAAGTQIRLRMGIPLFVSGGTDVAPNLTIEPKRSAGQLNLTLTNAGNAHIKIIRVLAYPPEASLENLPEAPIASGRKLGPGTGYLLPGQTQAWVLADVPDEAMILIKTDDQLLRAYPGMEGRGWIWRSLSALAAGPTSAD